MTKRLEELVQEGLISVDGWRQPEVGEVKSAPQGNERILLVTYIERGFSMPPRPFL